MNVGNVNESWAYHEAGHAVCAASRGAKVSKICLGPAVPASEGDTGGIVYFTGCTAFDQIVINLAGEMAQARFEQRAVNFTNPFCASDMAAVRKLVGFDELEDSKQVPIAIERVTEILEQNKSAVSTLAARLMQPPYTVSGEDLKRLVYE